MSLFAREVDEQQQQQQQYQTTTTTTTTEAEEEETRTTELVVAARDVLAASVPGISVTAPSPVPAREKETEEEDEEEEEEVDEDAPRLPPSLSSASLTTSSDESLPDEHGDGTESAADPKESRPSKSDVDLDLDSDAGASVGDRGPVSTATPDVDGLLVSAERDTAAAAAGGAGSVGDDEEDGGGRRGSGDHLDSFDTLSSSMGSGSRREHLYKILVIGELGTGKTSIIRRYVHQFFSQHYRATIGVDFALKVLHWDQNTLIRLQLWDIAGQERFGNMTRVYYKEAVGCFIVFDVSRSATFEAVMKWKNDVDSKLQLPDGSPVPCVLLANKCDLQKEGLVCDGVKMDEFCKDKGFIGWFETSAKENIGVDEAAQFLVSKILANDIWSNLEPDSPDRIALEPSASGNKAPNKCNC